MLTTRNTRVFGNPVRDKAVKYKNLFFFLVIAFSFTTPAFSQQAKYNLKDEFLKINAGAGDPLYTTYAAGINRSRMYGDKAYKMDYYSPCEPLNFSSDQAGRIFSTWRINSVVIDRMNKYHRLPVVTASFPDMALMEYEPWEGLEVQQLFFVYSSSIAIVDMSITNNSDKPLTVDLYPTLELGNDSLFIDRWDAENSAYILTHRESLTRLISSLNPGFPYPTSCRDIFTAGFEPYSTGGYFGNLDDMYNFVKRDFYAEKNTHDSLNCIQGGYTDFVMLHNRFSLDPGQQKHIRYFRGCCDISESETTLMAEIQALKNIPLQPFIDENERLFAAVPRLKFNNASDKLVYLGAFNLVRGCMLPPAGKTSHNFYVFSRNPLWGWGHGHQVLHESLSMLSYACLDAASAEESQRVYMEQQGADGLIAYRHGPRGMQDYPHKGMPTTSAPFYNWINWEIYTVSKDKSFLRDAYESGVKYTNWLIRNRDTDHDGTFEWGPYGIIENVRDWYNAVFQVSAERYLDVDKEDISDELECLDLTLMVVKEMRSLSVMAGELGREKDSREWSAKADTVSRLVNERMWDPETGFYYSVNKNDHSFRFMTRDLRRQEIIAFLALWAEAAPGDRAEILLKKLTDPGKFWRKYGVPTLAADDPWYTPYVDYCCKWNGPVWLLWNYMVFDGLRNYGYDDAARELAGKMLLCVKTQLAVNHNYWESYSPDNDVLDSPSNYIWDSIMAKLMIDLDRMNQPK